MLSMLLLLAAAPQATIPAMPPHLMPPAPYQGGPRTPVLGLTPPGCRSDVIRAADPTDIRSGLMWREGGEAVGLYRLLERRVNGCPAPIIVNYRVPGSNALGREMGRTPAPLPPYTPATVRVP
ncbi:MAG: hypothetical protein Q8S03_09930 [Brevundimonas sp.]|uniref:hypothetical protein n=1 Tax=Brevundimonas sp. TaxID=1871086 RepID=UPI00273537BE|nr:hypothetical protein [Brevundimonas sp.]MDP3405000.1 hypothetical protein [Brevundimonas sp.]